MNKRDLEKNILDLKYQFQMEKIRVSLMLLSLGILAFIGTFVWYVDRLAFGIVISILIMLIALFYYNKTKKQLRRIVGDIRKLA